MVTGTRKKRTKGEESDVPRDAQGIELTGDPAAILLEFIAGDFYLGLVKTAPVTAQLWRAYYEHSAIMMQEARRGAVRHSLNTVDLNTVEDPSVRAKAAFKMAKAIASWLLPTMSAAEARLFEKQLISTVVSKGIAPLDEAEEMRKGRRRGSPVRRRQIAVEALNLRLLDRKKWSWTRLARDLCRSEKCVQHGDDRCKQKLRQQVRLLEKFLHAVCQE